MVARKNSALPTRIWKFGARPPSVGEQHLWDSLRQARRYYNQLIEIERRRHAEFQQIRRRHAPDLAAVEDGIAALSEQIEIKIAEAKRGRADHWRATVKEKTLDWLPPEVKDELDQIRKQRREMGSGAKPLRDEFKSLLGPANAAFAERTSGATGPHVKRRLNIQVLGEMLREDWPAAWKEIAQLDAASRELSRQARAACSLNSGTYLQVEDAVARAVRDRRPLPPKLRGFRGSGKLAWQLKCTASELFSPRGQVQLLPSICPGKRGKQEQYFVARLKLKGGVCEVPVKLHRRPPDDAAVKWVALIVRKHGERTTYQLQLTLEHASFAEPRRPSGVGDGGHIRLGWGQTKTGIVIANCEGAPIELPNSILLQAWHVEQLRSYADAHFNAVKRVLRLLFGGRFDLVRSERRRMRMRRNCEQWARYVLGPHLGELWERWKRQRKLLGLDLFESHPVRAGKWCSGDSREQLAWWLWLWARKDRHLRQYAADSMRRFEARRDQYFRHEAIRLGTYFERVTVDSYSIAELKKKPVINTRENRPVELAQRNLQAAAPGRFREILLEVMGSRCTPCERPGSRKSTGIARTRKAPGKRGGSRGQVSAE